MTLLTRCAAARVAMVSAAMRAMPRSVLWMTPTPWRGALRRCSLGRRTPGAQQCPPSTWRWVGCASRSDPAVVRVHVCKCLVALALLAEDGMATYRRCPLIGDPRCRPGKAVAHATRVDAGTPSACKRVAPLFGFGPGAQGGEVGAASDVVVPKENLRADALTGRGERGAGKGWGREATTGTCGIDVTPGGTSCRTSSSRSGWCVTEISVYSHPSISKSRFAACRRRRWR